jgi:hypothetical protein
MVSIFCALPSENMRWKPPVQVNLLPPEKTKPMIASSRSLRDRLKDGLARVLAPLLSLNDPQWGRRPNGNNNQGPPDLDEIWRNLNSKLGNLLGKKGGGSSGGGALAFAVSGRISRSGQCCAGADSRDRLSKQRQEQSAEGSTDADR